MTQGADAGDNPHVSLFLYSPSPFPVPVMSIGDAKARVFFPSRPGFSPSLHAPHVTASELPSTSDRLYKPSQCGVGITQKWIEIVILRYTSGIGMKVTSS